jgi:ABC-2 type transport system permease protein
VIPSLALAWLITFSFLFALGTLGFLFTKTMALLNLYFGLFSLFSGYLMPIPLLPPVLRWIAEYSPFRFMFSVPVELMTRSITTTELAWLMIGQVAWAVFTLATSLWVWKLGLRRYEAVGG